MAWRYVRWAAALAGGLTVTARLRRLQARIADLERFAGILVGAADPTFAPFELRQQGAKLGDWWMVAQGGDTSPGTIDNLGACPCEHTYTVATTTFVLNVWPNPNPNPIAGFPWNAPPRKLPYAFEKCSGNCVQVCTKVWRGWMVVQNRTTGAIHLDISTFAQYHCKTPTDPDVKKKPEGEELPPEPCDVEP